MATQARMRRAERVRLNPANLVRLRIRLVDLVGLFGLSLAASVGCRGGGVGPTSVVSSAGAPSVDASAPVTFADIAAACDAATLPVVVDDPRLAPARDRERAHDFIGAARLVDEARKAATLSGEERCTWGYTAGRLYLA